MTISWGPLAAKVAPWVVAVVVASGAVAAYNHQQREIGRRDLLLATARAQNDSARKALAAADQRIQAGLALAAEQAQQIAQLQQAAAIQTARYASTTRALALARTRLDSAIARDSNLAGSPIPAAVSSYEASTDSSIKACQDNVVAQIAVASACERRAATLEATIQDLTEGKAAALVRATSAEHQVQLLQAAEPSPLTPWVDRAEGAGVLYLLLRLLARLR